MSIVKVSQALKHAFVPHAHNDYKPHFFREISLAIILSLVMFALGASVGSSFLLNRTVLGASITTSVLIDLTNESRIANREQPLLRSGILDRAAELKADDMVQEGYFAHTSPKGVTPWHWFREAGYSFLYAGENLAVNFTDASAVRDAWLASPSHRKNLLDVKFREIGMATREGTYKGDESVYIVQLFGTPSPQEAAGTPAVTYGTSTTQESPEGVQGDVRGSAISAEPDTPAYSRWYEQAIFGGTYYVQVFYSSLFFFVLVALVAMIVIEVRRQHWKHIAYGLSMLLLIVLAALVNQTLW